VTIGAKKAIAALPGAALGVILSMPALFKALLLLQALDFASGFMLAWSTGAISSDASRKGFTKKALALMLVLGLKVFESTNQLDLDLAGYVAGWFCLTELISIAENAGRAGLPIPERLRKVLAQLQEKTKDD
jgi:toxin secretion/phage lysis holin